MYDMPCGRSFETDVEVLLHSEECASCDEALNREPEDSGASS